VAVGDERAHAARFGECQRLAIMSLTALGIEPVRMARNLAEQVPRMSREPRLVRRGFQRPVPETPRVVETTERQRGSTQPRIEPTKIADVSTRDLTLDKLLTFPKPAQCLAGIAELRQVPFYPQALLDAIEQQQPFGYLGVI